MADALLITLVLLPAVLSFLLKSNAASAFLALCGGFAVITLSGSDIEHLIGKTKITSLTSNDLDMILLAVPLLLTLIFSVKAVSNKQQRILQVLPALCAGAFLAIVAGPMMGDALNIPISDSPVWKSMQNAQSFIVGAGLLLSLLLIWSNGFIHAKSHGKKHKK